MERTPASAFAVLLEYPAQLGEHTYQELGFLAARHNGRVGDATAASERVEQFLGWNHALFGSAPGQPARYCFNFNTMQQAVVFEQNVHVAEIKALRPRQAIALT